MNRSTRRILFLLFFLSGFCSLVYQVVWTRLAFAAFGIITPVLSVVISIFMLGLSVGSWAGGKYISVLKQRTGWSGARFYGMVELLIGAGAFAVPLLFAGAERVLLAAGEANSLQYLFFSALLLAVSILPWSLCMGATFPFIMAYIREHEPSNSDSFSYLYLANVLGAMAGTLLSAVVFIECFGFHDTLRIAAAANVIIATISFRLPRPRPAPNASAEAPSPKPETTRSQPAVPGVVVKSILFGTGFVSMALEVIWTRAFTPVLRTQVYSFALIVFVYLGATFLGSWTYRRDLRIAKPKPVPTLLALLAVFVFLPVIVNDPRLVKMSGGWMFHWPSALVILAAICPFCFVLGYLTPSLIDSYAAGDPNQAGRSYAVNVVGCILGPLFASYVLLPIMSEKMASLLLSLPCVAAGALFFSLLDRLRRASFGIALACVSLWAVLFALDYEGQFARFKTKSALHRDYAASVVAVGQGFQKQLLVNGMGMTILTPVTKFMLHLPAMLHRDPPQSVLVICFGMGTTFRSALSWNMDTTAVELVPSVRDSFGFYYDDAAQFVANPKGRIVIDDGRRFLKRTTRKFDLIVIDPPPPAETAGSGLLYSEEFYATARQHLAPHGILQAWIPIAEPVTGQAVLRSVCNSFPYVRVFYPIEGPGMHMLASMEPINSCTADEIIARMPAKAQSDLKEWYPWNSAHDLVEAILSLEVQPTTILNPDKSIRISDDQPFNEYFLLRRNGF